MSALAATDGTPVWVGDAGSTDPEYPTDLIQSAVTSMRALGLTEALKQRLVTRVQGSSPVAGADFTFVPQFTSPVELLGVYYTLLTSAAVANRFATFIHQDSGGNVLGRFGGAVAIPASTNSRVLYSAGVGAFSASATVALSPLPSPPLTFMPGDKIVSSTSSIDATDQISGIVVTVRDWSVGQVYWQSDLIARELGFETLTDLPASTALPLAAGQPAVILPPAR